jgi:hypothetical protein
MPRETITTIVVSLKAGSRSDWEATLDMSDDEYDAWDEQRLRNEERKRAIQAHQPEPKTYYDWNGYPVAETDPPTR